MIVRNDESCSWEMTPVSRQTLPTSKKAASCIGSGEMRLLSRFRKLRFSALPV